MFKSNSENQVVSAPNAINLIENTHPDSFDLYDRFDGGKLIDLCFIFRMTIYILKWNAVAEFIPKIQI